MHAHVTYMHPALHMYTQGMNTHRHMQTHHTQVHMERRKGGKSDLVTRVGYQWENLRGLAHKRPLIGPCRLPRFARPGNKATVITSSLLPLRLNGCY